MQTPGRQAKAKRKNDVHKRMSDRDFARLGGGKVAYIKALSAEMAKKLYPAVKGLPQGIELFALHAADGTPLAITDSKHAAIGHARNDKLLVHQVH
jgi:hypothetical protein